MITMSLVLDILEHKGDIGGAQIPILTRKNDHHTTQVQFLYYRDESYDDCRFRLRTWYYDAVS